MIILQVIYVFNVDIMRVIKIEYGENRQKKKNMVSYKLGQVRLFFFCQIGTIKSKETKGSEYNNCSHNELSR
ncbi:Uncharacterised protein [Chlamydia trachomatis]|nr:Uncharacterised protein [Chlamydia trachomatis]